MSTISTPWWNRSVSYKILRYKCSALIKRL